VHLIDLIAHQLWLDRFGDWMQRMVSGTFGTLGTAATPVANLLHGTWLGHPLHPIMTDIPLGAWSAAMIYDLGDIVGRRKGPSPADGALAIGIVGALGAAATGLTDWQHTSGRSRRVGVAHALLNTAGLLCCVVSLVLRGRGARGGGQAVGGLGYAFSTLAAYAGGHLVYGERVGTDHTAEAQLPDRFTPVLHEAALPEGDPRRVEIDGQPIVLVRQGDRVHALYETCSHLGGPLAEGTLQDGGIVCPWHGSRFALEDGRVLDGPASFPQPRLDARVRNGQIEVRRHQETPEDGLRIAA
jgi:nitrite reductase/ring-hydroxylating ferredoxin subunit